jgi:hypothetical protein
LTASVVANRAEHVSRPDHLKTCIGNFARTLSETRGFVKALVEVDSDRILSFIAFGVGAGEILAAVQIAMIAGLPYTALRDAVLTHPTLAEGLIALFSSAASVHNVVETRGGQVSVT